MPDRVWPQQEEGKTWRGALSSRVLQACPVKCPILEKYELLANHSDTQTPLHSFPSGWGSSIKLFAHGQGREIGLLCPVSEPYGVPDSVVWGYVLLHWHGWQPPFVFLSYVSLIFVNLVLGIFLFVFFKRNVYNWIALQWKQLGMLELVPAVSTALSRQPFFTELALGTKQALIVIKNQKIPNLVGDASLRRGNGGLVTKD